MHSEFQLGILGPSSLVLFQVSSSIEEERGYVHCGSEVSYVFWRSKVLIMKKISMLDIFSFLKFIFNV